MKVWVTIAIVTVVPFMLLGMAFLGSEIYANKAVEVIDIVALALQLAIIIAAIGCGIALWRKGNRDRQ